MSNLDGEAIIKNELRIPLVRPEMCEKCEYGWMNECHPCPDNINNPDCQYKKEYARLMLRMKLMNDIIPQNSGESCNCHKK